jgi:hypothetical protein
MAVYAPMLRLDASPCSIFIIQMLMTNCISQLCDGLEEKFAGLGDDTRMLGGYEGMIPFLGYYYR